MDKSMDSSITQAPDWATIGAALAAYFDPECVQFKPAKVFDDSTALVVAFIDARDVQDRLDSVVGLGAWEFAVEPLHINAKGQVDVAKGTITIHGVSKSDIGDAGDSGIEPSKSSASDAEKRAGVQWGIARYLYALPDMKCKLQGDKNKFIPSAELRNLRAKLPKPGTPAPRTGPYQAETVAEEAQEQAQPRANVASSLPEERMERIEENAWDDLQKRAERLGFDEDQFQIARTHYKTVAAVAAALDRVAKDGPKPALTLGKLHIQAKNLGYSAAQWDQLRSDCRGDLETIAYALENVEKSDLRQEKTAAGVH